MKPKTEPQNMVFGMFCSSGDVLNSKQIQVTLSGFGTSTLTMTISRGLMIDTAKSLPTVPRKRKESERRRMGEKKSESMNYRGGTGGKKNAMLCGWRCLPRTSHHEYLKTSLFGHSITCSETFL